MLSFAQASVPVIDLFAGPGGLGEGFSAFSHGKSKPFKSVFAVEKDPPAWRTLRLRKFFHVFDGRVPDAYYDYVADEIPFDELRRLHPEQMAEADRVAICKEMGSAEFTEKVFDRGVSKALAGSKNWVLVGGPPCQAYSLVGRSRMVGGAGLEKFEADPRHHLYRHYLRIIAHHKPAVFVMENVKGLLSAKLGGASVLERILEDLRNPSAACGLRARSPRDDQEYRLYPLAPGPGLFPSHPAPSDFVVRMEHFGVPQCRHRLIIVGVRQDIVGVPEPLRPAASSRTCWSMTGGLPRLRSACLKGRGTTADWLKLLDAARDSDWFRDLRRDQPKVRDRMLQVLVDRLDGGLQPRAGPSRCRVATGLDSEMRNWIFDNRLHGVCNHEARGHMESDLHRYLFAACFAEIEGRSPLLEDFPSGLRPAHANVGEALEFQKFNDRFRVQLKDQPSTTVVSHISKDGHYFIHPDPTQCRSLTVREAARLQTFPDNYFFEGSRTDQYRQVGNAVPPFFARQIARSVFGVLRSGTRA